VTLVLATLMATPAEVLALESAVPIETEVFVLPVLAPKVHYPRMLLRIIGKLWIPFVPATLTRLDLCQSRRTQVVLLDASETGSALLPFLQSSYPEAVFIERPVREPVPRWREPIDVSSVAGLHTEARIEPWRPGTTVRRFKCQALIDSLPPSGRFDALERT
jgi:hypothetical protein